MKRKEGNRYSIGELAEMAGISRRTVRYYVQEGLIEPPIGKGRGSHYDDRHLDRIARIRRLQRAGLALDRIRERLVECDGEYDSSQETGQGPVDHEVIVRIPLTEGARLELTAGGRIPSAEALHRLAALCRRALDEDENKAAGWRPGAEGGDDETE